ncbi:MAG TPA: PIG-L family deacetylase [Gammaproteobacteria bacterium]|nr:PIG-L family deacetylase [Gammaproteobacteria bacterium]
MGLPEVVRGLIGLFSRELPAEEVASRPAIVFAPHPDDETLIAGGAIAMKRARGTPVTVVYMTDGSASKLKVDDVVALRRREAIAACAALGVDEADIVFLDFPDGDLEASSGAAAESVFRLLTDRAGFELYAPFRDDGHPDHEATTRAVLSACEQTGQSWRLHEAPIWFWYRYPVVASPELGLKGRIEDFRDLLKGLFPTRMARIDARAWRERKQAALGAHRSQMTREHGLEEPALPEIARGRWLACLLASPELYRRSLVGGAVSAGSDACQ